MRSIIAGLSLVVVLLVVGCNVLSPHAKDNGGGRVVADTAMPKVEDLIRYLNDNAKLTTPSNAPTCRSTARPTVRPLAWAA
jgi:hypothetical protein